MSYGGKIYNAASEVVLDAELNTYLVSESFTASGVLHGSSTTLYRYNFDDLPNLTFPAFVRIEVGEFVGAQNFAFFSTQSSLDFFSLKPASDIPDPTGYDVVFYDGDGNKTWVASKSVVVLNSVETLSFSSPTVNTDADYVAPLTRLPYFTPAPGGGFNIAVVTGVERISSTQYEYSSRSLGAGPPVLIGPFPVTCMFAKST